MGSDTAGLRSVALVPARSGSKRVPDKNVRRLAGHPLIAYAIAAARQSGVFHDVMVSTDSEQYAAIARHYGADVPFLRPAEFAGDRSPDIEWVQHALDELARAGRRYEVFSILRPTNPFRRAETIQRAFHEFCAERGVDSLRAVELCSQHPGKMWIVAGRRMRPLLEGGPEDPPWHSRQYADLPPVHVQNASLEIAWCRVVSEQGSIAGRVIMPFFTAGHEGFDVNLPHDWRLAEDLIKNRTAEPPPVPEAPYPE